MNESLPYKEELSEQDLKNANMPYVKRKVLLLGGQEVGKTSLIRRLKNNTFNEEYEPTIQMTTKKVITLNNNFVDLEIVDYEGQNEYTIFSPNKFSFGYNAYVLVYDIQDKKSFELIKFIYEQINNLSGKTAKILVGAKSDNDIDSGGESNRQVPNKEGKKLADKIHCPFIEVSSRDNKNIEETFRLLMIEINKTESGVNLKKLKFYKIFEFFIHHQRLTIYSYYTNLIILFLLSILFIFIGISAEVSYNDSENKDNYYFGMGFPFTVLGLWGILFNICGIYGMFTKNTYLLEMNYFGLIFDGIYLVISICQICIIDILQKKFVDNIMENTSLLLFNILPIIAAVILSKIFIIIYRQDLQSYMA
jgi:Ras family protein